MDCRLTVEVRPELNPLSTSEWKRLFPQFPDPASIIAIMTSSDTTSFHSIVVRHQGKPILLVPLYESRHESATTIRTIMRIFKTQLRVYMPALFRPQAMTTGFGDSALHNFGFDREVGTSLMAEAQQLVATTFAAFSRVTPIQIIDAEDLLDRIAPARTFETVAVS